MSFRMVAMAVAALMWVGARSETGDLLAETRVVEAKAPLRVLMIGNSFSVCNVVHMPAVADALGLSLELASLYIPGCSLERHWHNYKASGNVKFRPYDFDYRVGLATNVNSSVAGGTRTAASKINLVAALEMAPWDVVTIQQASHESWQPATYQPGDQLVKEIRSRLPHAKIYVQETWSYTPWDSRLAQWGLDPSTMYRLLHAANKAFARRNKLSIIPVGTAIEAWRQQLPVVYTDDSFGGDVVGGRDKPLQAQFKRDGSGSAHPVCDVFHLAPTGEYLQSLVWTAKLFGVDVTACSYKPEFLTEEQAALMKKVAMEAVGRP